MLLEGDVAGGEDLSRLQREVEDGGWGREEPLDADHQLDQDGKAQQEALEPSKKIASIK